MKFVFAIATLLASVAAQAQGVLTLQGVVTQRTPESIVLKVDQSEFKIRRQKLDESQEKDIEKGQAMITLQVPVDAIQDIRASRSK